MGNYRGVPQRLAAGQARKLTAPCSPRGSRRGHSRPPVCGPATTWRRLTPSPTLSGIRFTVGMATALVVVSGLIAGLIIHSNYSTSSISSTDQLTIYQLQAGDCLQGSDLQTSTNGTALSPQSPALSRTQPRCSSRAMPGRGHWHIQGIKRSMTTDMRAASRRSARMTESTVRRQHLVLCLLLQTAALGLVVTGGWCVSPPRSGRWTIRSGAEVSNGSPCHG